MKVRVLGGVVWLLVSLSACGSSPDVVVETGIQEEIEVDTEFRDAVLEDGVVSRDEMEQAFGNLFACFKDQGLVGKVWHDLDYSNSYGFDGRLADKSVDVDTAGSLIPELEMYCENMYLEVMGAYAMAHPEEEMATLRRDTILACLRETAPKTFADADPEWDYETLQLWLYDKIGSYGREEAAAAGECVTFFGRPWTDLADW